MAVVMRGWSKTASTALKLATAERIIGYQFKDVDKLYEALDQTERRISLPSGKKVRLKPRNSRLALVGDALGRLHMVQDWYDTDLTGVEWTEIDVATLSNDRLGEVGFKLGLDECAIAKEIVKRYDMATTLEALVAAVHMDGASQEQCHKVYARFGLQHKLLDPPERLWIWKMVKSRLDLPEKFFIGHHFKLQEGIFETQLKRLPPQKKKKKKETGLWGRAKWLWQRTKRLWQPRKETRKKRISQRGLQRAASRSATQPPGTVDPLARSMQSAARGTTTPALNDPTSETEVLCEGSPGRSQDDEQVAAPEQTADREDWPKTNGAAESSTSEVPTSSKRTNQRPRSTLLEEDASTNDIEPAETGSQDSNTASKDEPAPSSSRKDVAATGVEPRVEHPSHEASEADSAEATKEDNSEEWLKQRTDQMALTAKMLRAAILEIEQAGDEITEEDKQKIIDLTERRQRIVDKRSRMLIRRQRRGK